MPDSTRDNRALDASALAWIKKTAHKNYWRVFGWYDLDDLVSDGVMCWQIVIRKYAHITERKHLMSLFMRTYINHIHKLSNQRTAQLPELVDGTPLEDLAQESPDDDLHRFITEAAPADLRKSLLALIEKPELLRHPMRRRLDGTRQTLNEFLCSLAKVDPKKHNLHSQLNKLIGRLTPA